MGLFKKIFKPVSRVLDKIIPNEIKPALPFAAAFAPFLLGPGAASGSAFQKLLFNPATRAGIMGGLNVGSQLAQEGNEGELNLMSTGLAALSGFGTAGGANQFLEGLRPASNITEFAKQSGGDVFRNRLISGAQKGVDFLQDSQSVLRPGGEALGLGSGIKAAALPASQAVGDTMFSEATRFNKQQIIDDALGALEEGATNADRALAIRTAMLQYGFGDDEITDTIAAAGYKAGGRVGFRFGGIDKAVEGVSEEIQKDGQEGIMTAAKEDPLLVEEYNKYVFDLMEQRPDAKPMSFGDFKRMIMSGMKDGGITDIKIPQMKEGGLMDLGGKEMDLRKGGFVPIGKKERADDVPARLSKNEFVMTADAVRAAGGGSVNEGAKRMYKVMNDLEARA
jgi:hypothetical protein